MRARLMTIHIREGLLYELLVVLFFLIVHINYMIKSDIAIGLRYGISFLCFLLPLMMNKISVSRTFMVLAILTAATGIINVMYIGNATYFKVGYTIMSFFIAAFFLSDAVSERPFLVSTYISIAIIIFRYVLLWI